MDSVHSKISPDSPESLLQRRKLSADRLESIALTAVLAPVRDEFDAVIRELETSLTAELPTVDAVSRYIAMTHGKGLRPALVLLSAHATGTINDDVRSAAIAIELLQASTLLHDDVIDDSPIRRGMPSVNARWGNDVAVLMGDILFTRALERFVATGSLPLMRSAARQARLMIEGEVAGRDLRRAPDFSESTYFDLIRRKTAALTTLAVEAGVRLGGATDGAITHMCRYGEELGIAFQIVDDVLDVIGDPEILGKPTGQDLRDGTVTLPLIRALAAAPAHRARSVRTIVEARVTTDEQWETIRRFIETNGGIASALHAARTHARLANKELAVISSSDARAALGRMLDYIIKRRL